MDHVFFGSSHCSSSFTDVCQQLYPTINMPSLKTHWRVLLVAVSNCDSESKYHHHAIYMDLSEGRWGMAYQVVGNARQGYEFMFVPFVLHPSKYPQVKWTRHVGWLRHARLDLLKDRCEHIFPPDQLRQWGEVAVPAVRMRTCETWASDVITRLQAEGWIEGLGWRDGKKGRVWVCVAGQKGPKGTFFRSRTMTWHPSAAPNCHVWPQ